MGWLKQRRADRSNRRTLLILWTLQAAGPITGFGVMKVTDLSFGTAYAILARCEQQGLVTSDWETPEPHPDGRPRRRYYEITDTGRDIADRLVWRYGRFGMPAATR
jgi:DNA-binding PadR family transcriptional regulator